MSNLQRAVLWTVIFVLCFVALTIIGSSPVAIVGGVPSALVLGVAWVKYGVAAFFYHWMWWSSLVSGFVAAWHWSGALGDWLAQGAAAFFWENYRHLMAKTS